MFHVDFTLTERNTPYRFLVAASDAVGNGAESRIVDTSSVAWDATNIIAVDCGVPKDPAGAELDPNPTTEVTVDLYPSVNVNEGGGPGQIYAKTAVEARWSSAPVPIPT